MRAKDVMSPGLVAISPEASITQAAALMLEKRISGLMVLDAAGALVGVLSEGDLLRRVELGTERKRPKWLEFLLGPGRLSSEYVQTHGRRVREVMTRDVVCVAEDAELSEVVKLMNDHRVKRIPVLKDGKAVGIVTRADLLRALQAILARGAVPENPSDVEIRDAVLKELKAQSWAPTGSVNLSVRDGVVEWTGCIFDEREREALRVAAENTPGVTSVKDRMTTVEPYSGFVMTSPDDTTSGAGGRDAD
ncbi:CBS domain-containing protein [Alsobacter sp. KACC 23698]|uniref:CBS domain-containing protein n=1 Tax=Alsobacter sp. KACC 23698 TaxID=3149229 RepID=A0AAU7JKW8_9HYPH